jgi:hypothetical protein
MAPNVFTGRAGMSPKGRLHFWSDCGKRASWRLSKRRSSARDQKSGELKVVPSHLVRI